MNGSLPIRPGALSRTQIFQLMNERVLEEVDKNNVGLSSFDLCLSSECWRMPYAIKPRKRESYRAALKDEFRYKPNTKGEFLLRKEEEKNVYVFRLKEIVRFGEYDKLCGKATGRSTLGRLDLLIRLVADDADCYDFVPTTQDGSPIYAEIIPITFDVIVKEGCPVSQLRLFLGEPELNKISVEELQKIYKDDLLRDEKGNLPREGKFTKRLTVNLNPDKALKDKPCAFRAKTHSCPPINIATLEEEFKKTKESKEYKPNLLNPQDYWEPLQPKGKEKLLLKKERFHILRSRERLCLPPHVAVACEAVAEELGELRIHYAGFAHPWFGRNREDEKGTPLIFEVRGHNFDTYLRHKEALATLEFYRMSDSVDREEESEYDKQELKLSKYFEDWK